MQKVCLIVFFICLFFRQDALPYDECFDGSCYTHLNSGWSVQGGVGCVKTGIKWHKKYNRYKELKKLNTYFYIAVSHTGGDVCQGPSVLNMEMLSFRPASQALAEFEKRIKKAIDWCWLAANNKLKFTRKNISTPFETDNLLEVNLFLYSDGTIGKTFVRMETAHPLTGRNFHWMHFNRQDLTRLKNDISALRRSIQAD